MKKIKTILLISLLISASVLVIVNNEVDVEASGGKGGGSGSGNNGIGLDNGFVWNVLYNLSNIIRTEYDIKKGDIPKGRAWGTDGDRHAQNLTEDWMKNESYCGLSEVQKITIGYLDKFGYKWKKYSSKIVVHDFNLSLSHPYKNYPFKPSIPITEMFPVGVGYPNQETKEITHNYSIQEEDDVIIKHMFESEENRCNNWPCGGTLSNDSLNVSCDILNKYETIVGGVSYIESDEQIPDFQDGRVFMMNESIECVEKIANITNVSGCILIYNQSRNYAYDNASDLYFSTIRINEIDNNLTTIIELLKNNESMIVDNVLNENVLTFTYNLSEPIGIPKCDFMLLSQIRDPMITGPYNDWISILYRGIIIYILSYFLPNKLWQCHGFIMYDSFDTHFMTHAMRDWGWFGDSWKNRAPYPVFSVNYSVGNWLWENATIFTGYPRATGYLNQTYKKQTEESPGVESYNVVGYRNITSNPDDSTVVISSRIDGFWGETPGDSGAGNAILLGIAKYFNDYDITPKHNLTFLMTTGEEYGMRGAHHFRDSHKGRDEINYILWLGTDELAYGQENLDLDIGCKDKSHQKIVRAIMNMTDYGERIQNKSIENVTNEVIVGTEAVVWNDTCDTIIFSKENDIWRGYHRAGANYTKGDVLDGIDRTDLNVTFEAFWNVTKYFTVDSDCWIPSNICLIKSDSDDNDGLDDTFLVGFDVESTLPHDKVWIDSTLVSVDSGKAVMYDNQSFIANRTEISKNVIYILPENESPGYYYVKTEIYNSTGIIDEIINPDNDNVNVTFSTGNFFLYPYNYSLNPPVITNISASPDPVGYGGSVTISADVTSNTSSIDTVKVNIYKPEDDSFEAPLSYNMTNTESDTYEYVFNDTWQHGMYNYTIWAEDVNSNETGSSQYSFNVSAQATVSVCTVQDEYGNNTFVNVTDPPSNPSEIGYELLDNGEVLCIWNRFDSYYFDTNSGIQLTNHYDEYWSHNVLMLGYYNNDEWNLIYRTDELSGFNKNITSEEDYVNATLWKDLSYEGYDFRLAIRYLLGVDDNELTIIPYIKNIGIGDIPYDLGFAWEIKDIQISITLENDYIEINGTTYLLNQSLDETYTNMNDACFYIREDHAGDRSESLYLRWDEDLSYKVKVESRDGQYNAPVNLGIKIGTLDVGQEKHTSLFWHDASEVIYYYDNYDNNEAWATSPSYMVDGSTSNYASTTISGDVELCDSNNCSGCNLGDISKVELRVYGYYVTNQYDIILRPVFGGTSDGLDYNHPTESSPGWSRWFDITYDPVKGMSEWSWDEVKDLDCDVEAEDKMFPPPFTLYAAKVEIRVTYTPNNDPVSGNPVPADGSTGVTIAPVLNITVFDGDGDSMNITWLSNSSGSWVAFGTNNSVGNGTYHQTMSNASVNGQWWYWKVNVTDGYTYVESSVYKFYTGYESKIKNTGSTNISGYVFMQVQYYDEEIEEWVVFTDCQNDTTPRTILAGEQLGLDTIFNGKVNTSDLIGSHGNGTYRVYACLRDPDGDVLVCDDETLMEDSYEFTVTDN